MVTAQKADADWYLTQWALWSANHKRMLPELQRGFLSHVKGSTLPSATISDDEALLIDRLVSELKRKDTPQGEAVKLYYFTGKNLARTAELIKTYYAKTDILVKSGVAWIDGVLVGCALV
jgi:Phage antitermination protein Q.